EHHEKDHSAQPGAFVPVVRRQDREGARRSGRRDAGEGAFQHGAHRSRARRRARPGGRAGEGSARGGVRRPAERVLTEGTGCGGDLTSRPPLQSGLERARAASFRAFRRGGFRNPPRIKPAPTCRQSTWERGRRAAYPAVDEERRPMTKLRTTLERPAQRRQAITITSGGLIALALLAGQLVGQATASHALMIAAAVIAGSDIAWRAWHALRVRHISIELLVTVATVGALLIGEYWEAAAVTFLFMLGAYLEARTMNRTRQALQELLELAPASAVVIRDGAQA